MKEALRRIIYEGMPRKPKEVARSLCGFTDRIYNSGELEEIIAKGIKDGADIRPEQFGISIYKKGKSASLWEKRTDHRKPYFWLDGNFAFVLQIPYNPFDENSTLRAFCGGFSIVDKDVIADMTNERVDIKDLAKGDIVINQLQSKKLDQPEMILKGFRWEAVLVDLICSWAAQAGFAQIYLLPSQFSTWADVRQDKYGRGYLRYDVSAKRAGFGRAAENGLYKKTLRW